MSISNSAVKKTAAFSLKNKYTSGVITACIYGFAMFIVSLCVGVTIPVLGLAGAYILTLLCIVFLVLPLTFGYVYWGTALIFTGECEPLLIFKYFSSKKDYFKSLKLSVLLAGNTLFAGILLFIPSIIVSLIASGKLFTLFGSQIPIWASSLWSVSYVLKAAAICVTILITLKYYLSPFLIAADEEMDPFEAMHMSKIISTRSKRDFIGLVFSFIGYIIACLLIIPIIFIFPYFNVSYNVHCRFAIAMYNKAVDSANKPNIPNFSANITF